MEQLRKRLSHRSQGAIEYRGTMTVGQWDKVKHDSDGKWSSKDNN